MTNKDAIEILYDSLGGRLDSFEDAFKTAIKALEENDELKETIIRLRFERDELLELVYEN